MTLCYIWENVCILRTFPKNVCIANIFSNLFSYKTTFVLIYFVLIYFVPKLFTNFENCSQFNRIYNVISGFGKEEMAPTYSCLNLRKLSMANNDRFFTEISSSGNSLVIIHIKEKAYIFISTELFLWSAFLLPEVDMKKYLL